MGKARLDVVVRVRPLLLHEQQHPVAVHITHGIGQQPSTLTLLGPDEDPVDYKFQKCFDQSVTQRMLFQQYISPAVNNVFAGVDTTVLVWGAPDTGKTFTMQGNELSVGIIPRCIRRIFRIADALPNPCSVTISYMEICNDQVQDLLAETIEQQSVDVQNLTQSLVGNLLEFTELYKRGNAVRNTSSMVLDGDRSGKHNVLTVRVHIHGVAGEEARDGKLHFIGCRLEESNQSLVEMGEVIAKLNGTSLGGPFSENKLTNLLRTGLGGCGRAIVFCNMSPSAKMYWETMQTLKDARELQTIALSKTMTGLTPTTSIHVLDVAADILKQSSIAPVPIITIDEDSESALSSTPEISKVAKSRKRRLAPPPEQRNLGARNGVDENGLNMEEEFKRWKQVKQQGGQSNMKPAGGSARNASAAGGVKRKLSASVHARKSSGGAPKPPRQLTDMLDRDPVFDKENQHNQMVPARITTVEKKPELLAKDLFRLSRLREKVVFRQQSAFSTVRATC